MATGSHTKSTNPAMRHLLRRRRLFLFLLAVVAPSVALIVLSFRMVSQERQLMVVRAETERNQLAREFGQILALTADRHFIDVSVSSSPATRLSGPVVLSGYWDGERLNLPWDTLSSSRSARGDPARQVFYSAVENAERLEFSTGRLEPALREIRRAIPIAADSVEYAVATTILSRLLTKLDRADEASDHLRALLGQGLEVTDEFGVPFALYAASSLVGDTSSVSDLVAFVDRIARDEPQLSPEAGYLLDAILDSLQEVLATTVPEPTSAVESARRFADAAIGAGFLQEEYSHVNSILAANSEAGEARSSWTLYHNDRWLVGRATSNPGEPSRVVVLDTDSLVADVSTDLGLVQRGFDTPVLRGVKSGEGQWLGSAFPGVYVLLSRSEAGMAATGLELRYAFIVMALLLVVGLAILGTVLWWRFTLRELRLAQLRSDFVSSVSHELKTPLTSIRMFAETLRFRRPSDASRDTYLDTILAESARLTRLLNNVLDFSRIERDSKQYQVRPIVLQEVIESALAAMVHPLKTRGFEVRVDMPDEPVVVPADRDAMEQVLLNLLSNAVKFSDDKREIHLSLRNESETAAIEIRDFGMGIPPEDVDRIFARFYRSDDAVQKGITGTGLGLPIVRHAVEAHGGRISVRSTPGEGTTFTVHLPVQNQV
jgi:signal transduction histidine kinase